MDDPVVTPKQQVEDLAELRLATQRRHLLRHGTPEWKAALRVEAEMVARVRRWSRPPDRQ